MESFGCFPFQLAFRPGNRHRLASAHADQIPLELSDHAQHIEQLVLGFALIRRHDFRVPAILLIAPLDLLPLTFVLEVFTVFAHPSYSETAVNIGLALLCVVAGSHPAASGQAVRPRASLVGGEYLA